MRPLPFGAKIDGILDLAVGRLEAAAVDGQHRRRQRERDRPASSLSLTTRTGTSTMSEWEISSGSFGSTLNGLRASMVFVTAPMRPSIVWPATST